MTATKSSLAELFQKEVGAEASAPAAGTLSIGQLFVMKAPTLHAATLWYLTGQSS